MIVDCHAHYAPQRLIDALGRHAAAFPSIELLASEGSYRLAFAGGKPTRPIMPRLRESEQRFAWMAEQALDHQVCGGWLDAFGYLLPPEEGAAWSRFTNEQLAEAVAGEPKLSALATVPLQDGRLAANVLEEAIAAGFTGVMIGTQPRGPGSALDVPDLDPFWEAASALGAVVFIHPEFDVSDPRVLDYDMVNAVARINDATTAVARLLFAGHPLRFPGARIVIATAGAAIPYCLGRLVRNAEIHPGQYADPREGFRRLWFDTVVFDPAALAFLIGQVGADRVMLGSDWPFPIGDMTPRRVVDALDLAEADRAAILGDTACDLFAIPTV